MSCLMAAALTAAMVAMAPTNYYQEAIVVDVEDNLVTAVDNQGNYWQFYDKEWEVGEICSMFMDSNATPEVEDDIIDTISHAGYAKVEMLEGVVLDSETGDGKLIYPTNDIGAYISYRDVEGIYEGAVVRTYLVYNPASNAVDDVIARIDIVEVQDA